MSLTINPIVVTQGVNTKISHSLFKVDIDNYVVDFVVKGGSIYNGGGIWLGSEGRVTLADLKRGKVFFKSDSSEMPHFEFAVSSPDGSVSYLGDITPVFKMVNSGPSLHTPSFGSETMINGEVRVITREMINAEDFETQFAGNIQIKVSRTTGGSFLLNDIVAKSFSLDDVDKGSVVFKHDGKFRAPTFSITAVDSEGKSSGPMMRNMDVQFDSSETAEPYIITPRIINAKVPVAMTEGAEFKLALTKLLMVGMANVPDAKLYIEGSTNLDILVDGVSVGEFTYADMFEGRTIFRHSGEMDAPTLTLNLLSGGNLLETFNVPFLFKSVNDAPVLHLGDLFMTPGEATVLDRNFLLVTDEETPTGFDGAFMFGVKSATNVSFHREGVVAKINSFSLTEVDKGLITAVFKDVDPSAIAYSLTVADPYGKVSSVYAGDVTLAPDLNVI